MRPDNLRHAAYFMLLATVFFAAMGALVKYVSATLPVEMVVFFRSAFGLLALLPWLMRRGTPTLRTQRPIAHVTRSAVGLASMACFFYAIGYMPLSEAVLLNYSAPLFIPFVAWLWLGERISAHLFAIVGLGFL